MNPLFIQSKASTMHMPFPQRELEHFSLAKVTIDFEEKILNFYKERTIQIRWRIPYSLSSVSWEVFKKIAETTKHTLILYVN